MSPPIPCRPELLDSKLPAAEERYPVGAVTGRLLFREEILRLLAAAEDAGRSSLSLWEVDERLAKKPEGTSIRLVVEELRREKMIAVRSGVRTATRSTWMPSGISLRCRGLPGSTLSASGRSSRRLKLTG